MALGALAALAMVTMAVALVAPNAVMRLAAPMAPSLHASPPPEPQAVAPVAAVAALAPSAADPVRDAPAVERWAEGPLLDVVRVERDGAAVFAGMAAPDSQVEVRADGVVVASATAGRDGGFVAFGALDATVDTHRVEISFRDADGVDRVAPPLVVAQPDPDAAPEAQAAVAALTETGVELRQAPIRATAEAPVTLDAVSYGEDGAVALAGRGSPSAPLRVFADARMIAETTVDPDGAWTVDGAALPTGDHKLRVETLDAEGRAAFSTEAPFSRPADARPPSPGEVVVQPGDTLWRIASNVLGAGPRYVVIYRANDRVIPNPDLIYPGQVLVIPDDPSAR